MPFITALTARAAAFVKDMADSVTMIYAEKGMTPFKKPLLISLAILFGIYSFIYSPLRANIEARSAELGKWKLIEANYSDYEGANEQLHKYQDKMPRLKDKEEWLHNIMNAAARTRGIEFDSLSAQTETEVGNFLMVSREASMTTTYAQLGKWLADVERTPILLRVSAVTINRNEGQPGYVRVTVKLSTVYKKSQPTEKQGEV